MGGNLQWPRTVFDHGSATKMLPEETGLLEHFGTGRILY